MSEVPEFKFEAIGYVQSPFKEKFGIPRQSGLASGAGGIIKLKDDPNLKTALRGLGGFSHIWLVFVFHHPGSRSWKPSIRPPRLGGARKVGVLASRSPHRPNPIGLSAVALERIDEGARGGAEIHVKGIDLLDQTPVLDVKPYLPYADSIPGALSGWASEAIQRVPVEFTPAALMEIENCKGYPQLKNLITEVLELDPRPAFQQRQLAREDDRAQGTKYGFCLLDFDVKWEIRDQRFLVTGVLAQGIAR